MRLIGADEAGKGPVLGSMFAAAVSVPTPRRLPASLADSKQLTPARRHSLAEQLYADDQVSIAVREIPPEQIDRPETDMNSLTLAAQATAVNGLANPDDSVIADASDVREARFARRLTDRIEPTVAVVAEHGADEIHDIVSAASIIAKIHRDAHIQSLATAHGDLGSGYPSDPTTLEFLRDWVEQHEELPGFARASWETSQRLLATVDQSALSDF